MNLAEILEIFDQLRDEQNAAINKAIQMCIKMHSRNGQIATATDGVHKESTRIIVDPSQEDFGEDVSTADRAESLPKRRKKDASKISSPSTPKGIEPMSIACLKSLRVSLSRYDPLISKRAIEMQNSAPNRHNSEMNNLSRHRGSNYVRKSLISPKNGSLTTSSDLSNAVTTNDFNSLSAGNLSSLPSRHSMKVYVNASAGNSSSRLANTSHTLSDIELSDLLRADKESIEKTSSTKVGHKLQTHRGENDETIQNVSAMDVVHCDNLSADTNNDSLSEFSPRINLQSPANNSSLNLSEVASMMSGYANGLDRLQSVDTHRDTDTSPSHFTGNSSQAEKNVSHKFLAESTPMALRPVLKTQQILIEGTVMQSPSTDASTLGSPGSNQLSLTPLIVTKNIVFRAARKSNAPHAPELILDTQLLSKSEASLLQQELPNFTATDVSFASQPIVGSISQYHASEGDIEFVRMIDGKQTSNDAIACEGDQVNNRYDDTNEDMNKQDNESVGAKINVSNLCEAAVPEIQQQAEVESNSDNEGSVIDDQIGQQSVDQENDSILEENSNKNAERRRTGDSTEDDDTDDENYNKIRLAKKIKATIRIPKQFVCDAKNCVSVFTTRTLLKEHKRTHKVQKPYKCYVCNKSFGYKCHLKTHLRIHDGEKPYNCSECDKWFSRSDDLSRHKRIHIGEKPFKCSICDKAFSQSSNLSSHKRIHNGEKPYNCSVCDKAFSRSNDLSRHMRIHNGEKPFKCSECNKSFSQSSSLTSHIRIHNGEKPYKCSECDKSFSKSSSLSRHIPIHNGEKPFKCSVCDKYFSRSDYLSIHKRIHNGERPYKCSVCEKSFRDSSHLSRHMKIHNGGKRHTCTVCGKSFLFKGNLTAHITTYHENKQPDPSAERFFCDYCGKVYFNKRYIELHCLLCWKTPKC